MNRTALGGKIRNFCRDDDGSYTVEIVMWLPALLVAFQFVTDATLAMLTQQNFYNVARDASRMVALGQRTIDEAESYIYTELAHVEGVTASVLLDNNFVTSSIDAPMESVTNMSGSFVNRDLSAEVSMWVENFEGS